MNQAVVKLELNVAPQPEVNPEEAQEGRVPAGLESSQQELAEDELLSAQEASRQAMRNAPTPPLDASEAAAGSQQDVVVKEQVEGVEQPLLGQPFVDGKASQSQSEVDRGHVNAQAACAAPPPLQQSQSAGSQTGASGEPSQKKRRVGKGPLK